MPRSSRLEIRGRSENSFFFDVTFIVPISLIFALSPNVLFERMKTLDTFGLENIALFEEILHELGVSSTPFPTISLISSTLLLAHLKRILIGFKVV